MRGHRRGSAAEPTIGAASRAHQSRCACLVVTGCYATLEGEAAAQLPNVDLVVGNARKDDLLALIESKVEGAKSKVESRDAPLQPSTLNLQPSRTRAFVKVQDGCHNRCTFCIVTVARGEERSRPVAEVVAEINALHAAGLPGGGVDRRPSGRIRPRSWEKRCGAWSTRCWRTRRIPRLRLSSLEPFDLMPDFFALWAAERRAA